MRYIKSNFPHAEMYFPPLGPLGKPSMPPVTLPRSVYASHELVAGKRNAIPISDQQYARLMADDQFKGMLKAGQYEFIDELPADVKTHGEVMYEKEQEIEALKAQIAELQKGNDEQDAKPTPAKQQAAILKAKDDEIMALREELAAMKEPSAPPAAPDEAAPPSTDQTAAPQG